MDFEDEDIRKEIQKSPVQFVKKYIATGAIFDEFQLVPEITKALKVVADEIIF